MEILFVILDIWPDIPDQSPGITGTRPLRIVTLPTLGTPEWTPGKTGYQTNNQQTELSLNILHLQKGGF